MAKERQQGNHTATAGNYKVPGMSRTFLCPPLCAGSMAAFAKNGQLLQQCHWSLMGIPTDGVIRAEEPLHSRAGDAAAGNTSYPVPGAQCAGNNSLALQEGPCSRSAPQEGLGAFVLV